MARSALIDPLDKFRWLVVVEGFTKVGFTSCQTPSFSLNINEYPEGGAHLNPRQIVNGVKYNPVIFTRGTTNDTSFNKWATGAIDYQQSGAAINVNSVEGMAPVVSSAFDDEENSVPAAYRRDVIIKHVNRIGQTEVAYKLINAFPVAYKPASDFNSSADDGFSIDSITLGYEGFEVLYKDITGVITNVVGSFIQSF